jgi:prevent-host-death family protein
MPAFEARRQFGKLLDGVAQNGDQIVVERNGHEVAAVVPVWLYRQLERERQEFFDEMRTVSERANLSEEDAEALAPEAVRWARGQLHGS